MSRRCELTGQRPRVGNTVSNANNRTKTRNIPNLAKKKIYFEPLNQDVRLRVTTRALRTIDKHGGLAQALLHMDDRNFSDEAKRLKRIVLGN